MAPPINNRTPIIEKPSPSEPIISPRNLKMMPTVLITIPEESKGRNKR